jgi:hypothetical protein
VPSIGDFHVPNGPEVGYLAKIIPNKEVSAKSISPFLVENEQYLWDGPYNTKDSILVTRPGQSMGRLFVTNQRILFWSDDLPKPHVGLFYEDVQSWRTSWMPMKSRAVFVTVAGREILFAANKTAVEEASKFTEQRKK